MCRQSINGEYGHADDDSSVLQTKPAVLEESTPAGRSPQPNLLPYDDLGEIVFETVIASGAVLQERKRQKVH
jgi:hypothetical protein